MSMLMEFSMWPIGKGESIGDYVAESLKVIDGCGIPYQFNAMGTVMEGELDELLDVVKKCFEHMARDCGRIECTLKFDYRHGATDRITSKVASVEKRLGRPLSK